MKILPLLLIALVSLCAGFARAQEFDFGDLPVPYPTTLPNGARHPVTQTLYIGNAVPDIEPDGLPSPTANGDDTTAANDEDGINPSSLRITAGVPFGLRVKVTNSLIGDAWLYGFADWNHDGDFADADESTKVKVPGGSAGVFVSLPFNVPASAITAGATALRLRLASDTALQAFGPAQNGEVEDWFIAVKQPGTWKDFGDLPDSAAGTAAGTFFTGTPPDYQTMAADGGPSHGIVPGLNFANDTGSADAAVDADLDGQPTPNVNGDDLNGDNDELGLLLATTSQTFVRDGPGSYFMMEQIASLAVQNITGKQARVVGFIDVNSDGDFDDADEQAPVILVPGDGSVTSVNVQFKFKVTNFHPAMNFSRYYAMRFRISTDATLGSTGAATDGEVMDSVQTMQFTVPAGGYDPLDYGDLPAPHKTLRADNGPRHPILQSIFLGSAMPDGEPDGAPSANADGDDVNATDDENAINAATLRPVRGFPFAMPVTATNTNGSPATISGFVDWNNDGDFADAGESSSIVVPNGSAAVTFRLPWNVPATAVAGPVAVRLRLANGAPLPPTGVGGYGEVEDFSITVLGQGIDYGDLPDKDPGSSAGVWGTGTPPDYKTRIADGGPSHIMRSGLYFADDMTGLLMHLDAEADGQPNTAADGDDNNGDDDENSLLHAFTRQVLIPDGAHSELEVDLLTSLAVTNTTGSTAYVSGFIDVNSDGDFDDPGEQSAVISIPGDGSVAVAEPTFTYRIRNLTGTSKSLTHAMRFRISTDAGLGANGPASDGEVHDELISYQVSYTLPDPQSVDYGDLPNKDYPTLYSQNGARHIITQTLFMGNVMPDGEADGQPTTPADGDDVAGGDDEDGFNPSTVTAIPGSLVTFPVKCANNTGSPATLYGFVDWNADGDFLDAGEQSSVGVPNGSAGVLFLLPWNVPATAVSGTSVAVRLRLSTDSGLTPLGLASNGEVEDYFIEISEPLDFGDLPARYPTTLAANGARHVRTSNLYLGSTIVDVESDGHPSPLATGDDTDGLDDEESVNSAAVQAVRGFKLTVPVTATNVTGSNAVISAFVDWNDDGDFADAGENVNTVVSSTAGHQTVNVEFDVPMTAVAGSPLAMRLRIASTALPPIGLASNGEVEDYMISVLEQALDFGDLPDSVAGTASGVHGTASPPDYKTRLADGGPSHVLRPGLYFARDTVSDVVFDHVDPETDGQPSNNADGDDLNGSGDDDEWATFSAITRATFIPDGTHSEWEVELIFNHAVTNTTGVDARVFGFIDINSDGDFDDAGEQSSPLIIPTGTLWASTNITFNFRVAYTGTSTSSYNVAVRSRISTEASLGPDGPAKDGEVQDDLISFSLTWDTNAMDMDYGDHLASRYPTTWAQNGARHAIKSGIFIGNALPDADSDGHSSAGATGDDASGLDDEDGFDPSTVQAYLTFPTTFPVKVTNTTGSPAELFGFVDWNDDGDFADAGEQSTIAVPNGTTGVVMNLPWTVPSTASTTSPVAVRLRLSTDKGLGPIGRANDGEVEDYRITVRQEIDFGDLPDSISGTAQGTVVNFSTVAQGDYRTRLADGGPWHYIRPDLALYNDANPGGVHTDGEADGHPSANADGDDLDGSDDEEVLFTQITSQTATGATSTSVDIHYSLLTSLAIKNETGVDAYLTGFLDANNDGDFTDPGETATLTIPSSSSISSGNLTFNPMVHLTNQVTSWTSKMPVRFRLSTAAGLGPDGPAADGEVEDYMITVSFSVGQWWPGIVIDTPRIPSDGLIDIGTPYQPHVTGDFSTATDVQWRVNGTPLNGSAPVLGTAFLQSLGTGQVPYSVSGRLGPLALRSHSGVFDIKNLGTFRGFMSGHSLTNETASPDADADGDGISNYAEFAFGTDPAATGQQTGPQPQILTDGANGRYFTLPYLRRSGGTNSGANYSAPDITYQPEASFNLTDWTGDVTEVPPPAGLPTPPAGYEWGAVRINSPIGTGNGKGFVRVRAAAP